MYHAEVKKRRNLRAKEHSIIGHVPKFEEGYWKEIIFMDKVTKRLKKRSEQADALRVVMSEIEFTANINQGQWRGTVAIPTPESYEIIQNMVKLKASTSSAILQFSDDRIKK